MPWSTALRTRWSSGSPSASTVLLSSSTSPPSSTTRTRLPARRARSRARPGKRPKRPARPAPGAGRGWQRAARGSPRSARPPGPPGRVACPASPAPPRAGPAARPARRRTPSSSPTPFISSSSLAKGTRISSLGPSSCGSSAATLRLLPRRLLRGAAGAQERARLQPPEPAERLLRLRGPGSLDGAPERGGDLEEPVELRLRPVGALRAEDVLQRVHALHDRRQPQHPGVALQRVQVAQQRRLRSASGRAPRSSSRSSAASKRSSCWRASSRYSSKRSFRSSSSRIASVAQGCRANVGPEPGRRQSRALSGARPRAYLLLARSPPATPGARR